MRNTLLFCTLLLGLLLPKMSFAQLTEADTANFAFQAGSTGYFSSGNVERLLLRNNLSVAVLDNKKGFGLKSSNTYVYGTFGNFKTEDDLFSRNFLYFKPKARVYPYLMYFFGQDFRHRIWQRHQAGVGGSLRLLQTKDNQLKFSLTVSREFTQYHSANFQEYDNEGSRELTLNRLTLSFFGRHHFGKLRFGYELWAQPALSDTPETFRYHTDAFLNYKIGKIISLQTALNVNYEELALVGVERNDVVWSFGVAIGSTVF